MTPRELIQAEHHRRDGRRDMTNLSTGATDDDIADLLADQIGNKQSGKNRKRLKKRWVVSPEFTPAYLPVAMLHPVRIPSGRTHSYSVGPIVIEDNFRKVEQTDAGQPNGFVPPFVIIDGQHRWADAKARGQKMIRALVGTHARAKVNAALLQWAAKKKKRK